MEELEAEVARLKGELKHKELECTIRIQEATGGLGIKSKVTSQHEEVFQQSINERVSMNQTQ